MIDGILPKPIYRSAYINLLSFVNDVETKLEHAKISQKLYNSCKKVLEEIKRRVHMAPSIEEIFRQNLKPDGKYIYFCPTGGVNGINDIDTIMKETKANLEKCFPNIEIVFYKTTSKDGKDGKMNREAFYTDIALDGTSTKSKLRIMFAINQYNEGVHAPNVDGVIMGRGTKSDIIFFEQLGRGLAVRENIKELQKELQEYYKEELIVLAAKRKIDVNIDMSKEEIIEKLVSPVIIDLSNNYEYIKELENNLKDRVREIREKSIPGEKRIVSITNTAFDIDIINQDLFEMLKKLRNKLAPMTWDAWYEIATSYYNHYGNMKMKEHFRTFNGCDYDENGLNLASWINRQKALYKQGKLSKERMQKLDAIGLTPKTLKVKRLTWEEWYEIAKSYYQYHGNLSIPKNFKTKNGYEYEENGRNLYNWLKSQEHLEKQLRCNLILKQMNEYYDETEKRKTLKLIEELIIKIQKLALINYDEFLVSKEQDKKNNRKK